MKKQVLSLLLMAVTYSLNAQYVYTDIADLKTGSDGVGVTNSFILAHDTASGKDIEFIVIAYGNEAKATCKGCEFVVDTKFPLALNANVDIKDATGTWKAPDTMWGSTLWDFALDGKWGNVQDKYLGFRFKKNTSWHYGWIRMDVGDSASIYYYATVKDFAYNTQGDDPIPAGKMFATSVNTHVATHVKVWVYNRRLMVDGVNSKGLSVKLTDMKGAVVYEGEVPGSGGVSLSDLNTGIYIVHLTGNEFRSIYKVLVR